MRAFQTIAWAAPGEALGPPEGQEGSPPVSHSKQNNSTLCFNQWVPGKILFELKGSNARMPHQVILKISFLTQRFPNQDLYMGGTADYLLKVQKLFCILWMQQRSSFLPCMPLPNATPFVFFPMNSPSRSFIVLFHLPSILPSFSPSLSHHA